MKIFKKLPLLQTYFFVMGTRSLVRFYSNSKTNLPLVVFYQQYDGYPSSVGIKLAKFLKDTKFNDIECLSAQYCSEFKKGQGFFYIYPVDSENEEWNYDVIVVEGSNDIDVRVNDSHRMTLNEFYDFCSSN
jgi:hypothetical protein